MPRYTIKGRMCMLLLLNQALQQDIGGWGQPAASRLCNSQRGLPLTRAAGARPAHCRWLEYRHISPLNI